MKKIMKKFALLLIPLLCTGCDECLGLLFKEQPIYYGSYFDFDDSYAIIKMNNDDLEYSSLETDQTLYTISNYEVPYILSSKKDVEFVENEKIFYSFKMIDEYYKYRKGWTANYYYKAVYFSKSKLSAFLKNYDCYYLFTRYRGDMTLDINNQASIIHNYFEIKTKYYNIFPFIDGKLKLNELQDFYINESVQPYIYDEIKKYKDTLTVSFTDYFWNDMSQEELEDSFKKMIDNPPDPAIERDWGW